MEKKISYEDIIFLSGSSGMAGSAILRSLKKAGYGNEKNLGKILTPRRKDLDLLNNVEVEKWFKKNKPTIVIIAAAKVGGIYANMSKPGEFILENLKIQTNIIENAFKFGVKRLLFLGSSCIYPKFAEQPINEEELLKGELEATNQWYAIAKIAGIKLCESFREQYNFDAISLMPTNLYGPGDNYDAKSSHVFAALIKKFCDAKNNNLGSVNCWGTGKPFREFMHVDDLGRAAVYVLENWDPNSKEAPTDNKGKSLSYLNVGTGKDISIKSLAELIAKKLNFKGEIIWDTSIPDGTPKKLLNVSRINSLGWEAKIDLNSGIERTIIDYQKNANLLQI